MASPITNPKRTCAVDKQLRILVVSQQQEVMDRVSTILERDGYIVSGTTNGEIAIDLASTTDFDAMLIGEGMTEAEKSMLSGEVRRQHPSIVVVKTNAPESVLTLLNQQFRRR